MLSARVVLFSVMLLCGCSHQQAGEAHKPANLIEAGKNLNFSPGITLHVEKTDGNSLEGIRLVAKSSDGLVVTYTADKGTVLQGADPHSIQLTLYDAKGESRKGQEIIRKMIVDLAK